MNFRTVAFCCVVCAVVTGCRTADWGGAKTEPTAEARPVALPSLGRYLEEMSGGLITPAFPDTGTAAKRVVFAWEYHNKRKVNAQFYHDPEYLQSQFNFDAVRFVRESGTGDFLDAAECLYRRYPFDEKQQAHRLPYRTPGSWGSLFHPPIRALDMPLHFYHSGFREEAEGSGDDSKYFDPEFHRRLDDITQTELTFGNRLRLLFNGVEAFPEKLRLAAGAKKFFFVAVMTIVADSTGQELIRVMVERKRAGVDVRLITEDFYTFSISNYAIGVLEREGIPIARVADKKLNEFNRMFHDKFYVRDGEEAILGGMNMLDYENEGTGFNFLNRDTDILMQGPAATGLLGSFIRLWKRYDKDGRSIAEAETLFAERVRAERAAGVRGREHYARWLGDPATRMNGICRTAVQGNDAEPENIVTLLIRQLEGARHSFYMTSPEVEFDPTRRSPESIDILALLMMQKARDPAFRAAYITNGRDGGLGESSVFLRSRVKDSKLVGETLWEDILTPILEQDGREVHRRVRRTLRPMVEAGVRGYQYFNYMHAKQFYFDRLLVGIGSWNFDSYSADNNHECMIFCLDEGVRLQMENQLALDMVNSVPVIYQDPRTSR